LILGTSVACGLAADLYGVDDSLGGLLSYWKRAWNRLLPRCVSEWYKVVAGWGVTITAAAVILAALCVFVAWFETYGY
jgi:hypothetical protein